MKKLETKAVLRRAALAAALSASAASMAAVGPAGAINATGGMDNIPYGAAGNIFQLQPMLFVQGVGSANDPLSIATLNPLLQYSFSVTGEGSSLMKINYSITNSSATDSFTQLRFMLFTNPDGDSVNFLDRVSESWGAAQAGDPDRREAREFSNPADTVLSNFQLTGNLTEGTDACLTGAGCDAMVGLQWNAPLLGPKETLLVSIGLSDDGQHLSSRFIDVIAVDSADTRLTLSGVASITAVPVPFSGLLFGSGLMALGAGLRRRRQV